MTRPRLTIRARLTLLYTGVFAACGAVVVVITYWLVARLPEYASPTFGNGNPLDFYVMCREAIRSTDEALRTKCERAFEEGVLAGAQGQRAATLDYLLQYSLLALVAATVLAAIAGWIVAGRVLRPVHQITAAARTASEHNLSARLALTGPRDELRVLADTFDAMLGRLATAFEGQQRFIADASHELRTPLTVMRTAVDVVLAKPAPTTDELRRMGSDVRVAVDHAESLVGALLTLARNQHGLAALEEVDLATVAQDALDAVDPGDRRVAGVLAPALTRGDPVLLERLVANLVDNAVRHNIAGGRVSLRTSTESGSAVVEVANTGQVIPAGAVAGLFEPFRRLNGRTAGDGFGLGLSIVASIAAAHGARVAAETLTAGGLKVTVTMPAAQRG